MAGKAEITQSHKHNHLGEGNELVKLPRVFLSRNLADRREERLRVDKARKPSDLGDVRGVAHPVLKLREAMPKVIQPKRQYHKLGPGPLGPKWGNPIQEECIL